jgi:hypothetical protein
MMIRLRKKPHPIACVMTCSVQPIACVWAWGAAVLGLFLLSS